MYAGRQASLVGGVGRTAARNHRRVDHRRDAPRPRAGVGLCQGVGAGVLASWPQHEVYAVLDTTGRWSTGRCWQPVARPRLLASHRCWSDAGRRSARLPRSFTGRATYHDDVTAALGIPPKDNGHELALIRSGRAPGSFTVSQRSARAAGREAKPPQSQSSN